MIRCLVLAWLVACSGAPHAVPTPQPPAVRTLTIIGTNDLHGALDRLPLFAGYVANLRAARAADGGGVRAGRRRRHVPGHARVEPRRGRRRRAARTTRSATPRPRSATTSSTTARSGPAVTAQRRSRIRAARSRRARREAKFPFLVDEHRRREDAASAIEWPNMPASTIVEVAGVKVGIIGASTEATPYTTMPANFVGPRRCAPAGEGDRRRGAGAARAAARR